MKPSDKLSQLNVALPDVAAPVGSYVPALRTGNMIYTSGQLPFYNGELAFSGKVLQDVSLEQAMEAARLSALNALAAAAKEAGGIDRISRIVRVGVYVNSSSGFTQQPKVANGASDFLAEVFGEAGRHARAAVGVAELPLNAAVELELLAELA